MKKYEKNLQKLIELTDSGCDLVHQNDTGLDEKELRFLEAKELICLVPAGDNEFFVRVEDDGLIYFDDKADRIKRYLLDNWISFLALIISVVALLQSMGIISLA